MNKKSFKILGIGLITSLICGFIFISNDASAIVRDGKKKLKECVVSSGGTVTMIGNTCEGSGDGCQSNPCI